MKVVGINNLAVGRLVNALTLSFLLVCKSEKQYRLFQILNFKDGLHLIFGFVSCHIFQMSEKFKITANTTVNLQNSKKFKKSTIVDHNRFKQLLN